MDLQRIAVLDLGTNTFHLLISEIDSAHHIKILHKKTTPVKLGEGGLAEGKITEAAFKRGIVALKDFRNILDQYCITKIQAAGTAALRMADNGMEFIDTVKKETEIEIEIIDGEKEAELIYEGVKRAVPLSNVNSLIIDIGGGSVEFIICNEDQIFWKKSYPIGAAKLMAMFHHSDPISKDDTQHIEKFLDEQLHELKGICNGYPNLTLIGSAGAFETFAELEIAQQNPGKRLEDQTSFDFNLQAFMQITDRLLLSNHEERVNNPAIEEIRVDMIIVASILTRYVLRLLNISQMKLSTYSLKEGMMYKLIS